MNLCKKYLLLTIFLLLGAVHTNMHSAIWRVGTSGDFTTISGAVSSISVNSGDTLQLIDSSYSGDANKNIDINKDLTITTSEPSLFADIDLGSNGRFCTVDATYTVTLENLIIQNGVVTDSKGGAIVNNGTLTALSCTFSNNSSSFVSITVGGGAIYNGGTLTADNCTFSNNSAPDNGQGGAIYNDGTLAADNCTFSGNSTPYGGQGGAIYNYKNGTIDSLTDCTFSGNTASDGGGAIYNWFAIKSLTGCIFSDNSTSNGGGAISNSGSTIDSLTDCTFINNNASIGGAINNISGTIDSLMSCTFSDNSVSGGGFGGAIYNNNYGTIDSLTGCTFSGNNAPYGGSGGAIDNDGTLTVGNCTFNGNSASGGLGGGQGGAIANGGPLTVDNCAFSDNSADYGGAIANGGPLTVDNCAFSDNSAPDGGFGGAIYNFVGILEADNCTFRNNNHAYQGGALFCQDDPSSPVQASIDMTSCTILNSTATDGGGIYLDLQYNLSTAEFSCNRIVNNFASDAGNDIYVTAATVITVTAQNNWWGTNTDPSTVTPALFYDPSNRILSNPWMEVQLEAMPPAPLPGQPTTVTADFTHNSDEEPITCNIPDGTPVNFSTNQGIIAPTSAFTLTGTASATLTPNNQSAKVCATVAPSQENYTLCSVVNPGFNRLNWGCVCDQTGDEGYFIGASADSASTDNKISAWSFDGSDNSSCTLVSADLAYTTTSIINHVVAPGLDKLRIGILAQQNDGSYRIDLATFDGTTFTRTDSYSFALGITASKIQFVGDNTGNIYIAVDTSDNIRVFSITGGFTFNQVATQANLNSTPQSTFLYWYPSDNGIYLLQGYYSPGAVPTVASYQVTLDPNNTVINPGVSTDMSTTFSTLNCCSTCVNYLVLGGSNVSAAVLVSCIVDISGNVVPGTQVSASGSAAYYCERCCCGSDHLLVGTDNGLFSYTPDFTFTASTATPCINTCWCCHGDNKYCAAVKTDHTAQVFQKSDPSFISKCSLTP